MFLFLNYLSYRRFLLKATLKHVLHINLTDLVIKTLDLNRNILHIYFFSDCTDVRLLKYERLDKLGLGYECVFMKPGTEPYKIVVQWLVNGVNVHSHDSQFDIRHYQSSDDVKSIMQLWIRNPIALRGPTEIKCSFMGVYHTFHMNSEILLNIYKYVSN